MSQSDESPDAKTHRRLDAINGQLETLNGIVRTLVSRVETRIPQIDALDDRVAKVSSIERGLAGTALKLAGAKAMASWWPGAIAGAVAGAAVAWVFLHSALAFAH